MTDKEIIKALQCCEKCNTTGSIDECCPECPLSDEMGCCDKLIVELAGYFNRQKTKIENLNVELVGMRGACESYKMHYDNAQAEIENLKSQIKTLLDVQQFSGGVD